MAFIDEPIGNSGNGKIMRTCPYNKQMVAPAAPAQGSDPGDGFMNIPDAIDEELPFN